MFSSNEESRDAADHEERTLSTECHTCVVKYFAADYSDRLQSGVGRRFMNCTTARDVRYYFRNEATIKHGNCSEGCRSVFGDM